MPDPKPTYQAYRVVRDEHAPGLTNFTVRLVTMRGDTVISVRGAPAFAHYVANDPDQLQFLRAMDKQLEAMREALHLPIYDVRTRSEIDLTDTLEPRSDAPGAELPPTETEDDL